MIFGHLRGSKRFLNAAILELRASDLLITLGRERGCCLIQVAFPDTDHQGGG